MIESPKLREKIAGAREQLVQNQEMVRLDLDLPLPIAPDNLLISPKFDELIPALEREGFRTLREEMAKEAEKNARPRQGDLFG
jgi:5'-3' exonuclease